MAASNTCERLTEIDLRWLTETVGEADLTPAEVLGATKSAVPRADLAFPAAKAERVFGRLAE
jgi:hypothetical protein